MANAKSRPWNDDDDRLLTELSAAGASIHELMDRLGRSRGSINGRLQRTGLAKSRPKLTRSLRQYRESRQKAKATMAADRGVLAKQIPTDPVPFSSEPDLVIPMAERRTMATLGERECRWPIGDPQEAEFHFCGKTKVVGLPYCEFHAKRAYQPPQAPAETHAAGGIQPAGGDLRRSGSSGTKTGEAPVLAQAREDA